MGHYFIVFLAIQGVLCATIAFSTTPSARSIEYLTAENTCRWTNCDEKCPTGFSMISRQGGAKDGMMWDHTHCEKRMQYFCCPTNSPPPDCTWRGHRSSGRCQPGCDKGEAEVGTLQMGCNVGFQSACCDLVAATEAYSECKWVGDSPLCSIADPKQKSPSHAPCPKSHPEFMFSSSRGFGGEHKCDSVRWDLQTYLPKRAHQTRIQKDDCKQGEAAYCCTDEAEPEPPKPAEPPKSAKVLEFEKALSTYLDAYNSGKCMSKEMPRLGSWVDDDPKSAMSNSASSDPVAIGDIFAFESCELFITLVAELRDFLKRPSDQWSPDQTKMSSAWDLLVGACWLGTSIADLADYLRRNPIVPADQFVNLILWDFESGAKLMKEDKKENPRICYEVQAHGFASLSDSAISLPQDVERQNNTEPLHRRFISPILDREYGQRPRAPTRPQYFPWLGTILEGIENGYLTLHYARWMRYSGGNSLPASPMLELAYWIGRTPGVWNRIIDQQDALWQYRDTRTLGRANPGLRDRWVVFHLHFDETQEVFHDFGGHTYTGFPAMTVFHAQNAIQEARGGWHVDTGGAGQGQTANTARITIDCPHPQAFGGNGGTVNRMWAGDLPHHDLFDYNAPAPSFHRAMGDFTNRLWEQGYLNTAGMMPIADPVVQNRPRNIFNDMPAGMHHNPQFLQSNRLPNSHRPNFSQNPNLSPNIWDHPYDTSFTIPEDWNSFNPPQLQRYNTYIRMPTLTPLNVEPPLPPGPPPFVPPPPPPPPPHSPVGYVGSEDVAFKANGSDHFAGSHDLPGEVQSLDLDDHEGKGNETTRRM